MKPEKILQSDVIDIIFENRNKEYGAYELRKHYNNRMGKALGITALVVISFGLMQSFKVPVRKGTYVMEVGPIVSLTEIPKAKEDDPKPKEVQKQKRINQPQQFAEKQFSTIRIEKDPPTPVATNADLDHAMIGKANIAGIDPGDGPVTPPSVGESNTGEVAKVVEEMPSILAASEIMPTFPGGKEAFIKFMQQNLRQPDDFDEGQKMTVIANFVVDAEGNIVNIDIVQNGRKDLDTEVIRVIKKMPRWNPGMQNGRKVAVYFKVPVTFVAPE